MVRDTIPKTTLRDISPFFREHFAAVDAGKKPDEPVRMVDLCPGKLVYIPLTS